MNILDQINSLLDYKNLSKAQLARLLKISPQQLNDKIKAKNLNLQFLTSVAEITNCSLQIYFQDNKYKQKLTTKKEKLFNRINNLNEKQYKLILDLLDNLKEEA